MGSTIIQLQKSFDTNAVIGFLTETTDLDDRRNAGRIISFVCSLYEYPMLEAPFVFAETTREFLREKLPKLRDLHHDQIELKFMFRQYNPGFSLEKDRIEIIVTWLQEVRNQFGLGSSILLPAITPADQRHFDAVEARKNMVRMVRASAAHPNASRPHWA